MIFMLCVVIDLNMCVECECVRMCGGLRVSTHIQILQLYQLRGLKKNYGLSALNLK
jgi:hypothetical protein